MENTNLRYSETHPTPPKNKGGYSAVLLARIQKPLAKDLYYKNISQKEIAKQLGITEKTVGRWAKEWRQSKTIEADTIANFKNRLLEMSIDKTTPMQDVVNLMLVIEQLETT